MSDGHNKELLASFPVKKEYRFYAKKKMASEDGKLINACSMKCEGGESNTPGKCAVCSMEMEFQPNK